MAVFYILVIMLMRVVQSLYDKKACLALPDGMGAYMDYLTLSKVLAAAFAAVALVLSADFSGFNAEAFVIAMLSGTFLAIGSYCGIKALLGGTIVLSSICATAGLIVPCILGAIFLNEPMSPIQIVFIAVLLFSTVLLMKSSHDLFGTLTPKTVLCLFGNFFTNGMVMFCQKLFGIRQPNGNVSLFSMLTFLIPAVMLAVISLTMHFGKHFGKSRKLPKKIWIYASFLAFAVFVIQQFVTLLSPKVSSAVLFSFVNGGATVIAAAVGAAVYREKLTLRSCVGIVLAVASMICIKIFE